MTRILRNKKGVTLVELLAVIVILGIIAAIAVPTIGGLINRQRENAAIATYESIEFAAVSYGDGVEVVLALQDLEDDEFIDLKNAQNEYEIVATTDPATGVETASTAIYMKVTAAGVVTFWLDAAATADPADLYVNGFLVHTAP
ncbi:MAG: prepilin-type N-terminal cleavage/methylation domain-containing protein [Acholeplasmataceae bacterium]|nr:prepilin-type N-terminal cleavage/methylation domain-containing protein [Acholeplasmataceae bacterium]